MITAIFFKANRQRLIDELQGGLVVISAYAAMQRSLDSAHAFEQEANFWYLTGIEKPGWWLIIDGVRHKSWLVSPNMSQAEQIFDGQLTADQAIKISGVDTVITRDEATSLLRDLARTHSVVYSLADPLGAERMNFTINPAGRDMKKRLERTFSRVSDARLALSQLRAIKQPVEIKAIKKSIKLTTEAFEAVKGKLAEFHYEYEIEAEFSHYFRANGARGHAYDPIVAAGKNACTLHYSDNQARLKSGQLVLIDIGSRLNGYAADITRTYAYGKQTAYDGAVHAAVDEARRKIIDILKPGLTVDSYHDQVDEIMKQAMIDLKLIKSTSDDAGYRRYFPHAISHGLGVDVHDPLGRPKEFKPGMVLTVEPGIYIPEKSVGVRLEDDILITPTGHENLSRNLSTAL